MEITIARKRQQEQNQLAITFPKYVTYPHSKLKPLITNKPLWARYYSKRISYSAHLPISIETLNHNTEKK